MLPSLAGWLLSSFAFSFIEYFIEHLIEHFLVPGTLLGCGHMSADPALETQHSYVSARNTGNTVMVLGSNAFGHLGRSQQEALGSLGPRASLCSLPDCPTVCQ